MANYTAGQRQVADEVPGDEGGDDVVYEDDVGRLRGEVGTADQAIYHAEHLRMGEAGRRGESAAIADPHYVLERPAKRTTAANPSSLPGHCRCNASMPAARTTDRRASTTITASSAYPMTGMKSGTRSIGSAR